MERRPGDELLSFAELKEKYCIACDELRDEYELPLVARALEMGIPVLAICRGIQVINAALGGGIIPDLGVCVGGVQHSSGKDGLAVWHDVEIDGRSRLRRLLPGPMIKVNSYHHQGVLAEDVAAGLEVAAEAPDGVVEAVEGADHPWLVAVQWHPERAADRSVYNACRPLFGDFVAAARMRL